MESPFRAYVPAFSGVLEENMRKQFFPGLTRAQAKAAAPWAAVIIKVEGGYLAFESADDAATWRRQK